MTTDLLQRIAKCAPKEMGAEFYKGYRTTPDHIQFNNVRWKNPLDKTAWVVELVATDEPYVNSQGCDALLDAMERELKVGYCGVLLFGAGGGTFAVHYLPDATIPLWSKHGPTRAIAVGEAFCKVFEGLR